MLAEVLHEIKETVQAKKPVVVSMVTGVSIAEIADLLELTPKELEVIRIMPNVNAEIAAGMTALNASPAVTETNFLRVKGLFEMIGQTEILPEKISVPLSL